MPIFKAKTDREVDEAYALGVEGFREYTDHSRPRRDKVEESSAGGSSPDAPTLVCEVKQDPLLLFVNEENQI